MEKQQDRRPRSRIPRFKSREEEATFWDTHDSTEFEDLWHPVRVKVADEIQHVFAVPLDRDVLTRLIETSRATGLRAGALAARLIAEGLDQLSPSSQGSTTKKGKRHG
jgi:hypothetical protein